MRLKRTLGSASMDCHFECFLARTVGNDIFSIFILKPIGFGAKHLLTNHLYMFSPFLRTQK